MLCSVCEEFLKKPPNVWRDASSPVLHLSFEAERNAHVSTAVASQGDFLYHSTLRALQINAVQQTCHLCTLVWSRLQRNFSADLLGPDKVTKALQDGFYASEISPQVRICVRQVKNSDSYIYLCVDIAIKGDPQGLRDFLPILTKFTALLKDVGKPLGPSTSDNACFVVATEWLDTCIMQHEDCYPHRDFLTIVPARLLDVGDPGDTGLITLHATNRAQG